MKIFCLCLIVFSILVIVVGIIKLHELPGQFAPTKAPVMSFVSTINIVR